MSALVFSLHPTIGARPDGGPPVFNIMPTRYEQLEATLGGLKATGVTLLRVENGAFVAAGMNDDPGIYVFVPWIARTFDLSVQQAADAFFIAILAAATLAGLIGLWFWSRKPLVRAYGSVAILAMAYAAFRIGDVYLLPYAVPVAFVPWLMHVTRDRVLSPRTPWLLATVGLAGGCANAIRGHSATATALFALVLIATCTASSVVRRAAAILVLTTAFALVALSFGQLEQSRDAFLAQQARSLAVDRLGHPFWHTAYIGLAYVDNPFVAEYSDVVAYEAVERLEPGVQRLSAQYERVLRDEYVRLAKEEPLFFGRSYGAKLLALLRDFVIFLNVGLVMLLLARPPKRVLAAFAVAIPFSALPGLIAIPRRDYLLGYYTLCALFAIVAVDAGWEPFGAWMARRRTTSSRPSDVV